MSKKKSSDTIGNRTRYLKYIIVLIIVIVSLGISVLRLWYGIMYSNYVLRGKLLLKL